MAMTTSRQGIILKIEESVKVLSYRISRTIHFCPYLWILFRDSVFLMFYNRWDLAECGWGDLAELLELLIAHAEVAIVLVSIPASSDIWGALDEAVLNKVHIFWNDPHSNCGSGSGSRRAKITHKNRKKSRIFMFLSTWCLRAQGFSCSLGVLYGGLGISKLQFLIKKIEIKFPAINFFQF